ncbi:MAG: 16S rRNA (adenine(1518)-N(6)/adenine(1519)-N(6))-dimethyltransferase RsmA [Candidatus Melainabacteria bacterium]|nr:16S rRNA (adenine(1518)-N(6)/adenine(1519)-N(6))-dimethyltransferase RsmA [Candidatus Melainabacteria bacterium]
MEEARRADGPDLARSPVISTREELLYRARKVWAKKKLGQNFFVDPEGLDRIVDSMSITSEDHVLEIGFGLAFLTEALAATGAKITGIELDRELIESSANRFESHVNLLHGDFLDFDLDSLSPPVTKIVGNVPYQITSPIIAHIFGEIGEPSPWYKNLSCVVMTIQREVAERLIAKPGSKQYSHLTVLKDYLFDAEILFTVPPLSFFPVPDVTSSVVRLTPLAKPPIEPNNMALFKRILRAGFKSRRKMLKNNLAFLKLTEPQITSIMRNANINPNGRAEDLSIQQFAKLSDALGEHLPDDIEIEQSHDEDDEAILSDHSDV